MITGYHGDCQDLPHEISKASTAIVAFFPSHRSFHHDSCLLTFSCPSFLSVQPWFKGHQFPFFFFFLPLMSHIVVRKKRVISLMLNRPSVGGLFGGKENFLSVTGQLSCEGFFLKRCLKLQVSLSDCHHHLPSVRL